MAQSKCLSARLPTFGLRSNGASCNFLQAVGGRFRRSRFTYGPENGHWHSYKTSFLRYLCSCLVFQSNYFIQEERPACSDMGTVSPRQGQILARGPQNHLHRQYGCDGDRSADRSDQGNVR